MDFSSRNETLQVDRATLDLSKLSNFRTVLREDEKREINQIIEKSSSIFTISEDFRTKNSRSNRIIFITFKIFFLLFFIEKRNFFFLSKISWKNFHRFWRVTRFLLSCRSVEQLPKSNKSVPHPWTYNISYSYPRWSLEHDAQLYFR